MPIKTSSGKWKWGNVERSSKKELVQTVYGIWKKNGSKGSFSKFLKGTHESNEKLDLFRIPEDSMLDIYDIQEYKGSGFKEYNYLANCIGGEGTLFDDASEMASWINNFCQVIPIEKVKDRLNGAPSELVNAMKKLEQEEKLDDLDEIVCAIDAVKQGYHEPRDMMFVYVSSQDIHYFFECSGALTEATEDAKTYAYHCTDVDPEIIKKEGWKVGDGFTLDNQFKDLYKKYLPNVPVFVSRLDVPVWDSKAKYCIKLDITGLKLFPDFGYLPDFGAYYDYDEECFYWENEDDLDSNKKLKDFVLDNCDNLTLYADCFDGKDSFDILGTACVDGSKLKDRIVEWKSTTKESLVNEYWDKRGKYFYCHDCDKNMSKAPDDQYIMIDDDLWEYVCKHGGKKIGTEEDLCRDCIEKRLGRPLTLKDLGDKKNLPVNDAFKNMLKYGNRDIVSELCKAVAKHKVRDEDGDMVSVAFGGNCGIFAYTLLMFLNDVDYNFYEWRFGLFFDGIRSLSQIYNDNNDADLNHVVAIIDDIAYDGSGKTNLNKWYGKLFQIDDAEEVADIIDQFTTSSIGLDALYKIFEREWKNLTKKKKTNESVIGEEQLVMGRIQADTNQLWFHGTKLDLVSFKERPPTPDNIFYIADDIKYSRKYGKNIYALKLSSNLKAFNPMDSKCQADVKKNFPAFVYYAWIIGLHAYLDGFTKDGELKAKPGDYTAVDMLSLARNIFPDTFKDFDGAVLYRPYGIATDYGTAGTKEFVEKIRKSVDEYVEWLKNSGLSDIVGGKKSPENIEKIRKLLIKKLHDIGYNAYLGIESRGTVRSAILGLFDISAIDKIGLYDKKKNDIASESLVSEKKFNLYKHEVDTDATWFHGTNSKIESFKTRPPTPDNIFYVAQNKAYAKKYGKDIYAIKLSDNIKPFNVSDEKCLKDVEKAFPDFVSFCWLYGVEAWTDGFDRNGNPHTKKGVNSPIDLLSLARDLFPEKKSEVGYEPFFQVINYDPWEDELNVPKKFAIRMEKSFNEYLEWLKNNGCGDLIGAKRTIEGHEKLRKLLIKKLHELGYDSYLGIETSGNTNSVVLGLFDISAIDKIAPYSDKKANESYEPPYTLDTIKQKYGVEAYRRLRDDPVHRFRAETGIEVIHKEPTLDEFERIVKNWDLMTPEQKKRSDEFSIKQFGRDNKDRIELLRKEYDFKVGDRVTIRKGLRCRQSGHSGEIIRVNLPEDHDYDSHGFSSFTIKMDDPSLGITSFQSGAIEKETTNESIISEGKSYNVVKINSSKELYKKYGGDKTGYNGKSEWFPRLSSTYKLRPINDKYCLFVLEKKDWDKIEPPNPNTTNAYDDYGTSLIAIVVEVATGKLLKATLRWNHIIDPNKTVTGTSVDKAFLGWNDLVKVTGKDIETEIIGNLKDKIDAIKKDSEDADNQINEYLKDNASSIKELDPNSNFKIIKKFSDKVTKIEIPNGITRIGDLAFNGCSNLASISIPDTVTSIGDGAFERCTSLASISIPDTVTSIGEYAFAYCSNLTSISIPDSVTSIKSAAFYDCSNLTSVSIPDSVTNIGDYIFYDCSKLNEIYCSEKIWNRIKDEIPEDVERKDPNEMKKESVVSEDKTAMIKKLVLPDIEDQKEKNEYKQELLAFFKSHSNFENKIDWNKYKTLTKKDFDPIIASAENTKGAEKRREKAEISSDIKNIFKSQKGRLFSIVGENDQWLFVAPLNYEAAKFCDSSENQGAGAQWCIGYEKTDEYWYNYIHDGSVFVMAFNKDYKNLSARDIKKKLKFMIQRDDEYVYHVWNQPDKDITSDLSMFGDEKQIADDMFDKAAAKLLEEKERLRKTADTDIPKILKGVTVIEKKTLNKYMDLVTKIVIPDNVTEIGDEAFCMFSELTSVTIPNSVTTINRSAFSDCHNLVSVNIPNSVTIIESGAFQYCGKLESIAIPDSVIKIGSNAFSYCSGLTGNLEIPDSVESIGDAAFRGCDNLTSVRLPANIKNIGDVTFCRCFNLKSINIPNGVERIGIWAFSNCENLRSTTIPDSVTSMGMDSFGGCKNLKTIYCSEQTWNRFKEKLLRDLKDVTRKDPTEMKKESIGEAAMIHSYPETLQPIIDRIVKGNEDYELDHAYFNKEGKFIWMRNSKGYFHIFKPVKLKNVKWKPFAFRDLILQDDGMMKPLDLIQFNDGHEGLKYLQTNYNFNANTMI